MPFDKKHYRAIKKFMDYQINHVDFRLADTYKDHPTEYAATFLPMISFCIQNEDYEGAKACSDAIKEFVQRFTKEPMDKLLLRIPEYVESEKIRGILCYGKEDDPSGIACGGAEWI